MLQASNLVKSFGAVRAVDDVSFSIDTGEIVGFLGPNGAGKTTTMRLLAGFLTPDAGDVTIESYSVVADPVGAQKYLGYLAENNPLYSDLLVHEFLELSAKLYGLEKNDYSANLDFAVEAVGIEEVFSRPINALSKGFKQRVGIAATILHKPKIIIMDEPTEGLDPNQRGDIRNLIKSLGKKHTILLSTHVMQEAAAICNRILVINNGKIIADGSVEKLAKSIGHKRVVFVDIQGSYVERELKRLPETILEGDLRSNGHFVGKIQILDKDISLQPEITKIAFKHKWVIWKLAEEENKLEDIFAKLTKNKEVEL